MEHIELAREYLEIFFSGTDLERLYSILDRDLKFSGPFLQTDTAKEYVQSLVRDPPMGMSYKITGEYQSGNGVCVIYLCSKAGVDTLMAQEFRVSNGRLGEVNLIFDTGRFA